MALISLDDRLRPQLGRLDPKAFETFWLTFLRMRPELTASRNGMPVTKRVIDAEAYGARTGMKQKGIDIRAVMEGGEEWVFQCKQVEKFGKSDAVAAMKEATYSAQHFFLITTCDPGPKAQDEISRHPNWTLWGMEEIRAELAAKLRPDQMVKLMGSILTPADLRRFLPLASEALVPAERFFKSRLVSGDVFRHDWPPIGRDGDLKAVLQLLETVETTAVIIEAKGGDGKSRLLLELAKRYEEQHPDATVLFYNPGCNESLDPLENCLDGLAGPVLVIVDDAHRTEEFPRTLPGMVKKRPNTKLVLASRPHAADALRSQLNEAGLDETRRRWYRLQPLARAHVKELASLALEGSGFAAGELTRLTADSVFLTVVAGDLIRRGRLTAGEWTSDQDFRIRLFNCFEAENLHVLPAPEDRRLAGKLLRLVAILSPVPAGDDFIRQAAVVLAAGEDDIHSIVVLLESAALIMRHKGCLRVVPDLFSDFLVHETAFGRAGHGTTPMVKRIMEIFTTGSAAIIRNIAEAGWMAGGDESMAAAVLRPLLDHVKEAFRTLCFCRQAAVFETWEKFGLLLPRESLALADEALFMDEPPAHVASGDDWWPHLTAQLCQRELMVEKLSPLLREIALCHEEHQFPALDRLWKLAARHEPGWIHHFHAARPLEALAEVFSVSLRRPIGIVRSALNWLENKVIHPLTVRDIAGHAGLLSAVMRSCFSLTASGTWWKGAVVQWKTALQSPDTCRSLYGQALAILRKVIDQGDLLAAIHAVTAAEPALRGLSKDELELLTGKTLRDELAAFRDCVREAMQLLRFALDRHPHWLMRLVVFRILVDTANWSHDRVLVPELRRMANQIPEDMDYRAGREMTGGWLDEDGNVWESGTHDDLITRRNLAEQRWQARAAAVAMELADAMPDPEKLADGLAERIRHLTDAGLSPQPRRLLRVMAATVPGAALDLMHWLINHSQHDLACHWTLLIKDHPLLSPEQKAELLRSAIGQPPSDVRLAAVQAVLGVPRDAPPDARMLAALQAAAPAFTPEETRELLQYMEFAPPEGAWAHELFRLVPLASLPSQMAPLILRAVIPDPFGWHTASAEDVRRVLEWLEPIPEIPAASNGASLTTLCEAHPRLVFDFLCRRLDRLETMSHDGHFEPIPTDYPRRLWPLASLKRETDFPAICDKLRAKATMKTDCYHLHEGWKTLYQSVVLPHPEVWTAPCIARISMATAIDTLTEELELLAGNSIGIAFRHPDVTRTFLLKAEEVGGLTARDRMRWGLFHASSPELRSWSPGVTDPEHDRLQSAALKAARAFETDPILGPFYRWVVEREEKEKQRHHEMDRRDFEDLEDADTE